MKYFVAVVLLASAALAWPQHGHHGPAARPPPIDLDFPEISPELYELIGDMMDFQSLYPVREFKRITRAAYKDPAFRSTIEYLHTPEFHAIVETIMETSEIEAIANYTMNADWPWLNKSFDDAIRMIEAEGNGVSSRNTVSGGLDAFLDAIIAVLPKEQLRALFDEKMAKGSVFRACVDILTTDEFKGLLENAQNSPVLRAQFQLLAAQGINVEKVIQTNKAFFGF